MGIASDAQDCECRHRPLVFFQGWHPNWSGNGEYEPTFLKHGTFWDRLSRIILGASAFVLIEAVLIQSPWEFEKDGAVAWVALGGPALCALVLAFGFSFASMVCFDIACHFCIGRTWYLLLDHRGQLHVHRWNPVHEWSPTAFTGQCGNWVSFLSHHRIFQVRSGGFWRRNRVIANGRASWKLSVGVFGNRLILTDPDGSALAVGNRPPQGFADSGDRLKETLRLVAEYSRVNDVIVELEEQKQSVAAFNALGAECAGLIRLMETSKQTMGRSKHAQLLRERLEAVFQEMPEGRVKNWTEAAEKAADLDS